MIKIKSRNYFHNVIIMLCV